MVKCRGSCFECFRQSEASFAQRVYLMYIFVRRRLARCRNSIIVPACSQLSDSALAKTIHLHDNKYTIERRRTTDAIGMEDIDIGGRIKPCANAANHGIFAASHLDSRRVGFRT